MSLLCLSATPRRETQQFDSLSVSRPVSFLAPVVGGGSLARTGTYVAKLNAGTSSPRPLGPLKQLSVQQGDTISITAPGYYPQPVESTSFAFSLTSFVASLLQQPAPVPTIGAEGTRRARALPLLSIGVSAALPALVRPSGGVPLGYVRLLVFDADSNLVSSHTRQLSQAAAAGYEELRLQVVAPKDGYITAYVGNESNADVFFDDVQVEHRQGLQIQENHYDPWGMSVAGLDYSPGLRHLNQYQWNGKEKQNELGLNWNHQDWRFYDAQIGKWHVVDPLAQKDVFISPYAFGRDNALRYSDPDGREVVIGYQANGKDRTVTYINGKLYNEDGKAYTGKNTYVRQVSTQLDQLRKGNTNLAEKLACLQESSQKHTVMMVPENEKARGAKNTTKPSNEEAADKGLPSGSVVRYDPNDRTTNRNDDRDPRAALAHELLGHGSQYDQGRAAKKEREKTTADGIPVLEAEAVKVENQARLVTGDPPRTTYGGKKITP